MISIDTIKRVLPRIIAVFLLTTTSTLALANPAAAEKGYRYWGYFQAEPNSQSWVAAMTGPTVKLKDGAVEGWSFSISNEAVPAATPSENADFASLCADTPAASGKIRVGLVINFGPEIIAPNNEMPPNSILNCALVKKDATGIDVLNTAVTVRNDKGGLLCGIEGYPAAECGPEVDMPSAEAIAAQSEENEEALELENEVEFAPIFAVVLAALLAITLAITVKKRKRM
jgi:hypothetical protein